MHHPPTHLLKAFIIGSSFPVIIWPFLYLGIAKHLNTESTFAFALIPITLPFVFGIMNIIQLSVCHQIFPHHLTRRYWFVGISYGLILSLAGNFYGEIPQELFGLPDMPVQYLTIPAAMLLYGLIFRYIVKNLNSLFTIEPL